MQKQNEFMQEQSNSIAKILNFKANPENVDEESSRKVQKEIIDGDINVFDPQMVQQEIQNIKAQRKKKQEQLERIKITEDEEKFKSLKREIIKLKREQTQLTKKEKQIKSKAIVQKVKKWQEIQAQIQGKKISMEKERQRELAEQQSRQKEYQRNREKERNELKRRHIEEKLKEIDESRRKRQEIIRFSSYQYSKLSPKYLEIEKKFKRMEEEVNFQKDIYKKSHKIDQKIDHASIKQHEKKYMSQVNERIIKRKTINSVPQEPFTPFVKRNEEKISQEKQKLKRRKQFQQKLKQIPIAISEEKKIEIEIARDKGKNPLKYHFLSQKALNEEKIYEQFKQFQINTNHRQLGKEYLKQLTAITQQSRMAKSQSVGSIKASENSGMSRYKDYLKEVKPQRREKDINTDDQMLLKQAYSKNKEHFLEQLDEQARRYDIQLKRKQQQLASYNKYQSAVKKVKEIDQAVVKSIQAKLACLQFNS